MTQRKLTGDELEDVMIVRGALRKIRKPLNKLQCIDHALIHLDCVALQGTTDGKPWVDPEPPIPDGYRLAVAGDEGREDCKFWSEPGGIWKQRSFVGRDFEEGSHSHYIVPVDRTPTDEDAEVSPRIEVMVRNRDNGKWRKYTLLAVFKYSPEIKFLCFNGNGSTYATWKQCRHLYPGE